MRTAPVLDTCVFLDFKSCKNMTEVIVVAFSTWKVESGKEDENTTVIYQYHGIWMNQPNDWLIDKPSRGLK